MREYPASLCAEAWLELDRAARPVHHHELPTEQELVHVVEGPASQATV
jgi:hypothetical protein